MIDGHADQIARGIQIHVDVRGDLARLCHRAAGEFEEGRGRVR